MASLIDSLYLWRLCCLLYLTEYSVRQKVTVAPKGIGLSETEGSGKSKASSSHCRGSFALQRCTLPAALRLQYPLLNEW
jgi:hypothetical protein